MRRNVNDLHPNDHTRFSVWANGKRIATAYEFDTDQGWVKAYCDPEGLIDGRCYAKFDSSYLSEMTDAERAEYEREPYYTLVTFGLVELRFAGNTYRVATEADLTPLEPREPAMGGIVSQDEYLAFLHAIEMATRRALPDEGSDDGDDPFDSVE